MAVSGPRELLAEGWAAPPTAIQGQSQLRTGTATGNAASPGWGDCPGVSISPPGTGTIWIPNLWPDDWLCLLSLIDLLSLLKTATNSPAPSLHCWHMWDQAWDVSRAAEMGLSCRGWDAICCTTSPGPALQQLGTVRGCGAAKAGTCCEGYVFCKTA